MRQQRLLLLLHQMHQWVKLIGLQKREKSKLKIEKLIALATVVGAEKNHLHYPW